MANRGREFVALGKVLVNEPRNFPSSVLTLLRKSLRTVWDARGGGLYACGFVITFVWLEISLFLSEIAESSGIGDFFGEQLIELLLRFTFESLGNTIQAFIWPVRVIEIAPPWGAIVLGLMFFIFPRYLKHRLERILFDDEQA